MADVKPDSTLLSPPSVKKLKQARLPFAVITEKEVPCVKKVPNTPTSGKKRKLSDSAVGPCKSSKHPRNDENCAKAIATPSSKRKVHDAENEVSSSSETDPKAKTPEISSAADDKGVKKPSIWDKFRRSPQKLEITTTNNADSSGIVDLTDSNDGSNVTSGKEASDVKNEKENIEKLQDHTKECTEKIRGCDEKSHQKDNITKVDGENETNIEIDSSCKPDLAAEISNRDADNKDTAHSSSQDESTGESLPEDVTSPLPSQKSQQVTKSGTKRPLSASKEAEKIKRREEMEKARQEKVKQKEEKERQRKEEKEKKDREREELKRQKEQERKDKMEQKEKERLEKLKQKEEEKQKKEEERLQKLEQKNKELEEKQRLKEEQEQEKQRLKEEKEKEKLRLKEEKEKEKEIEELKNRKNSFQKEAFKSFFTKKEKQESSAKVEEENSKFLQFELKKDMRLAPLQRICEATREKATANMESIFASQNYKQTYLKSLKSKDYTPGKAKKTWESDDEEVVCMEDDVKKKQKMKVKFFKFHENYRPPYYGTWKKRSKYISARNPLGKDTVQLDYEVDSDDEWEEEEPGESLSDCENNKEGDDEDDGDDDNEEEDGFFVPHGYLSEGEGCEDEEEEEVNPERLKMRQMAKAKRWESEMNAKVAVLRSVCIGCLWWNPEEQPRTPEYDELIKYQVVPLMPFPISTTKVAKSAKAESSKKKKSEKEKDNKPKEFPEEAIPDLIRLVHRNPWSYQKITHEFRAFWQQKVSSVDKNGTSPDRPQEKDDLNTSQEDASPVMYILNKSLILRFMRTIATYDKTAGLWLVSKDLLEKHNLVDLPEENQWNWITRVPEKKRRPATPGNTPAATPGNTPAATPEPSSTPGLTTETDTSTPKSVSSLRKLATTPSASPKVANTLDIKDSNLVKEPNPALNAKSVNTQSIMKFAKPGVSPSFPIVSPKPIKADATPPPAKIAAMETPKADTPKRAATKTLTPSSLFVKKDFSLPVTDVKKEVSVNVEKKGVKTLLNETKKDGNVSVNDMKKDDNVSVNNVTQTTNGSLNEGEKYLVEEKEQLKPDKNQPSIMQMFAKKPSLNKAKKTANRSKKSATKQIAAVNTTGDGTAECPMEID